jgi:hypothetical protein
LLLLSYLEEVDDFDGIDKDCVLNAKTDLKKQIIQIAKSWPIYFCRLFPVELVSVAMACKSRRTYMPISLNPFSIGQDQGKNVWLVHAGRIAFWHSFGEISQV